MNPRQMHHSLLKTLTAIVGVYVLAAVVQALAPNSVTSLLQGLIGFFFATIGFGFAVLCIVSWLRQKTCENFWEFLAQCAMISFLLLPLLVWGIFLLFGSVTFWQPSALVVCLWIVALVLLHLQKASLPPVPKGLWATKTLVHPLALTGLLLLVVIAVQVSFYAPLPDLDPYKWLNKYEHQFASNLLDHTERPLFGAQTFVFSRLLGVEIFIFYKYILPLLTLTLLLPAWMVARRFTQEKKRWLFLLFLFTSPVILFYGQLAMPQFALMLAAYYAVFLCIYAHHTQRESFFYAAGCILFVSFLFHQAAAIFIFLWLLVTLATKWRTLLRKKILVAAVIVVLALSAPLITSIAQFLKLWTVSVISYFGSAGGMNLLYPAQFSNVDRTPMGWQSLFGVVQFYAFHMGPLLFGLFAFAFASYAQKKHRHIINAFVGTSPALLTVLLVFTAFFAMAEILPRYPGIALLPDRAWIFAGITAYALLYVLLVTHRTVRSWVFAVFLLAALVGIGGNLYVSYIKKFLITPTQLESAAWIKANLPEERLVISYGHKGLLPIFSHSPLALTPAPLFCSDDTTAFQHLSVAPQNNAQKHENVVQMLLALQNHDNFAERTKTPREDLSRPAIVFPLDQPLPLTDALPIEDVYRIRTHPAANDLSQKELYIYHAQQHARNPYASRPYKLKTWGIAPCADGSLLFDRYPAYFERVYEQPRENIIIWKVRFPEDPVANE